MTDLLARTRALYEITPLLVALYDPADRLRYANPACRAAHFIADGETPTWEEMVRRNHAARRGVIITTPDFEAWIVSTRSRRGKLPFRTFETSFHDGRWVLVTETVAEDGWMLTVAVDVTDFRSEERVVRQARDRAISAAHTDELTGVSNRRFVTARLCDILLADGPGGCLCVLDLDKFKHINDRYGHQTGDDILRDFAIRIMGQVRRSDCFGRVGGEEFVLVLPGTGAGEAQALVARMLEAVRRARPHPAYPELAYTFSAGIAQARRGDTFSDIYSRADRALYAAKQAGRDRVEVAEGDGAAG